MQNNFKNPFQLDEEDTIITLDQNYTNQQFKPQTFNANPPVSTTASSEGSMFNPLNPSLAQDQTLFSQDQQIPLLQDIGIDVGLIKRRITAIITLGEVDKELIQSPDLSGPLMIAFLLGFLLLLGGKIHFSDIQTVFIIGNIIMYILFNFMVKGEQQVEITLYSVTSYLGYSLLPMLILAILGIFLSLKTGFGIFASLILAGWSSYTSGALMSLALNRSEGRILIMYPLFLFYLSFALIIIF